MNPLEDDHVGDVLAETDRKIDIQPATLAEQVMARVRQRRRGIRRIIAGSAVALLLVASPVLIPAIIGTPNDIDQTVVQLNEERHQTSNVERIDLNNQIEQAEDLRLLKERLRQLQREASRLRRLELEQELLLTSERFSRTITQFKSPYPVFLGE